MPSEAATFGSKYLAPQDLLALAAAKAHARLVQSELADDAAAPDVLHSARALAAFVLAIEGAP